MATSERILTTPPHAGHVEPLQAPQVMATSGQAVWLQALLDFGTVLSVLTIASLATHATGSIGQQASSHLAIALMATATLAFAGAYPRVRTPLNIASTAGLLRAALFVTVLLTLGSLDWRLGASREAVLAGLAAAILLVAQREGMTVFFARRRLRPRYAGSTASYAPVIGYSEEDRLSFADDRVTFALKRVIDIVGAAILLVLTLPLGLVVAALIKLDSEGPIFLRQKRIGRYGVPFYMWKFRSMYVGVARYARSPVSDCDPRLTKIGRALRRLSIDELPQLLNVLKGEMSLVGPRPEMPFIVKDYTAYERLRLHATPGITGLWQISPARAMPIHHNLELDLFYIQHRSFFLDTAIMLRTVTAVVRGIGAL